nr:hypothetical protein [Tanacetum cinerariifolium]
MVSISWKKFLTSKQKGGLGLSNLFALNHALMFKWLWRFKTQILSLWSRVIKTIYGVHGALDKIIRIHKSSPWLDILCEVFSLKSKGIDLCALIRKKVETCKYITVATELRHNSLASSFRRPPMKGAEKSQFDLFNLSLADLIIPQMLDHWFWSLEGLDEFSVKSTCILINDSFHSIGDIPTRWVKLLLIRIIIFAWRVFLDKLPTWLNLSLRVIQYLSPSPIPVEDSDSLMEEIDLSLTSDDSMPPGIKNDDYDSEGDILFLEEFLSNDSLSLLENESFHFDVPSSTRPPGKPPDDDEIKPDMGILTVKVVGDISEHYVLMPRLLPTQTTLASNEEKSPHLLSHQGFKPFQLSSESPMVIYGGNIPILDVPFLYFYPPLPAQVWWIRSS